MFIVTEYAALTAMITLPYCNFKVHCANTKSHPIIIYRHADCLKKNLSKTSKQPVRF